MTQVDDHAPPKLATSTRSRHCSTPTASSTTCPPTSRSRGNYLDERFHRNESVILVAEDAHGELVGFTQLYPAFCSVLADRTFVLYDLFVTPAARGTGAGRALMEAAESYARAARRGAPELQTAKTNTVGQSLYESCGWKRDDLFYVYAKGLRDGQLAGHRCSANRVSPFRSVT